MFPIRCATVVEIRLQQMGDFYKNRILQWQILNFRGLYSGGWKFLDQTTKRHTLTPNLVENIVWRMCQWRCFDTIRRREKSTRESPLEIERRLPRRGDYELRHYGISLPQCSLSGLRTTTFARTYSITYTDTFNSIFNILWVFLLPSAFSTETQ